jgi:hypothetical protein
MIMRLQLKEDSRIKLLIILALAALVRFIGLGAKQLWLDEILQVLHARPNSLSGIFAAVATDRGGAPLDYLIQHFFISNLSGAIEWTARLHAAILGVLAVWLVYLVCRELFADQRLALMSALLFCFYPFHHHYSQEGRPYSLFLFLTLILYLILFRLLKKNSVILWISFGALAILDFYTFAFAAAALFSQFVFLIYYQRFRRENWTAAWRRYACFIVCGIVAAAAYLPWLRYSFFNAKGDAPPLSVRLFIETIKRLGSGYPLAILLIVCAIAGVLHLIRTRRALELGALLIWIIAPLPVIFGVLMWRTYFFEARQLLFITPAFFMLVAAGVEFFKQKFYLLIRIMAWLGISLIFLMRLTHFPVPSQRLLITLLFLILVAAGVESFKRKVKWKFCYPEAIIILLSIGAIALNYPALNNFLEQHYPSLVHADTRDDVRAAGKFLKEKVRQGDLVASPHLTEILLLYFPDLLKYAAYERSPEDLMSSLQSGSRIIYAAPRFNPDPERLKILFAHMQKSDEKQFQGITIYFFSKP